MQRCCFTKELKRAKRKRYLITEECTLTYFTWESSAAKLSELILDENNPLANGSSYLYSSCFSWLKAGQRSLCLCFKNFNSSRIHPGFTRISKNLNICNLHNVFEGTSQNFELKKSLSALDILLCHCKFFFKLFLFLHVSVVKRRRRKKYHKVNFCFC